MIVIKGSVHVPCDKGYAKCVLHKSTVGDKVNYSLSQTKIVVPTLPKDYEMLTLSEVIARYGDSAVDDSSKNMED